MPTLIYRARRTHGQNIRLTEAEHEEARRVAAALSTANYIMSVSDVFRLVLTPEGRAALAQVPS
jgi:hypothetical protein